MSKCLRRFIRYDKFRNLGIKEPQDLVLNENFEKDRMGNLLVLIGSNNSGKSNVLDGIQKLNTKKMEDRDVTELSFDNKDLNPSISLHYKNDETDIEYVIDRNIRGKWKINKLSDTEDTNISNTDISKDVASDECKKIFDLFEIVSQTEYCGEVMCVLPGYDGKYVLLTKDELKLTFSLQTLADNIQKDPDYSFEKYKLKLVDTLRRIERIYNLDKKLIQDSWSNSYTQTITPCKTVNIWRIIADMNLKIVSVCLDEAANNPEPDANKVSKYLGVSAVPDVHRYQEKFVSGNDLNTNINALSNSQFFRALFKSFEDYDVSNISNAYNQYSKTGNHAILKKLENDVNPRLDTITERFNKLYFASNDKYIFTLRFEDSKLSFGMARGEGEDPITLEHQSTGFRWFFDFFFSFLADNSLKAGDIVIMDEPATNLHPQGQAELRKFIKEFAVKNDILFIIATHSPFLIDPDNYDELRVVSMKNNHSTIDNLFTVVNNGDPNSLLPIKESLTIKQNVLYDLDTEVVWVEGLTDYIYLTMFKNLLDIKNMAFLPFNGVGTDKEESKEILKKIVKIKFHKRSMLVDADKAGMNMYNLAENADFYAIHNLSKIKIDGNKTGVAKEIEDLFSSSDREKYREILINKKTFAASELKIHAKKEDFSTETINNFQRLFDLLKEKQEN